MGLATALLFGDTPSAATLLSSISSYLVSIGVFISVPVIALTFPAGIASLGKDRKGGKVFSATLSWAAVTAIVLSLLAASFILFPISFPTTSTAGSAPATLANYAMGRAGAALSSLFPVNPFLTLATCVDFIFPLLIILWILGLSITPSCDVIRPAYTVMNSFSEAMYRLSRTYAVFGFFIVAISSASAFMAIYQEKTLIAVPRFAAYFAGAALLAMLAVIPLLFGIFTGFRKNPYKIIYRSIAPMLLSLMTGRANAAIPVCESIARQNNGVQKRVSSVSIPIMSVIGKGGSAFISVLTLLSLFMATAMEVPSPAVAFSAAGAALILSFASSAATGAETAFIVVASLDLLGINLYGAENAIIAVLPFLAGLGVMIDSLLAIMGASVASLAIGTDANIPYSDAI